MLILLFGKAKLLLEWFFRKGVCALFIFFNIANNNFVLSLSNKSNNIKINETRIYISPDKVHSLQVWKKNIIE